MTGKERSYILQKECFIGVELWLSSYHFEQYLVELPLISGQPHKVIAICDMVAEI